MPNAVLHRVLSDVAMLFKRCFTTVFVKTIAPSTWSALVTPPLIVAISSKSVVSFRGAFPTRSACTPVFLQGFASCHWSSTPSHRYDYAGPLAFFLLSLLRPSLSALRDTEYNLPPIVKRVTTDRHQTGS